MCDRCKKIFSEAEDGWETYTGSRVDTSNGERRSVQRSLDACPECASPFDHASLPAAES